MQRELKEEIGISVKSDEATNLDCFSAHAANEANSFTKAEIYYVRTKVGPANSSEIEYAIWVTPEEAEASRTTNAKL